MTKDELKNALVLEDVRYKKLLKGDISLFKKKMTLLDPDLDSHFKAAALEAGFTESTVIRAMIRLFVTKIGECHEEHLGNRSDERFERRAPESLAPTGRATWQDDGLGGWDLGHCEVEN